MSANLEPAIWSRDTDQHIPRFDRCQLTMTYMSNIAILGDSVVVAVVVCTQYR